VNRTFRSAAGWAVKLALTLAVTYFLFRSLHVSWGEIANVDRAAWRPRPLNLAVSVLVLLAVFLYLGGLWALMVRKLGGPSLRFGEAIAIFYVANLGRYVPGKVWQLLGLMYLAGKRGVSLPVASSAAVLGQIYALGAAAIVGALGLGLGATSRLPRELVPWALALIVLVALVVTVPPVLRSILRLAFRVIPGDHEPPKLDAWFGVRWLGLYLVAWAGYGVAFGALWSSFPVLPPVSWAAALGAFSAAYFVGYAAIFAPAGVGVREGAMALILAPWTGAAGAAVLAVIARLWMTLVEFLPIIGTAATGSLRVLRENPGTENHAIR
jgi:uncharacterized membrane protein YbhN (UPF0104 family)